MIPATVTHADMLEAVTPLLALLNVDPMTVYTDPPVTIVIGGTNALGEITLSVPNTVPLDPAVRSEEVTVGSDPEFAEQGNTVKVMVV